MKSSDIHFRAISHEMLQPSITKICWKITYLQFHWNLPRGQRVKTYSGTKSAVFLKNEVSTRADNALAPCMTRPLAAIMSSMYCKDRSLILSQNVSSEKICSSRANFHSLVLIPLWLPWRSYQPRSHDLEPGCPYLAAERPQDKVLSMKNMQVLSNFL